MTRAPTMKDPLQPASGILARLIAVAVVFCCLLFSGLRVHAGDLNFLQLAQTSTESDAIKAWKAALPPAGDSDWVQTRSGEWLKGELRYMYEETLEFNSDEFGLQLIDWSDVAQFRGHGIKRLSIETPDGPIAVDGLVDVNEKTVFVVAGNKTQEFSRGRLISIAPGATKEIDNWAAKIGLGVAFSRGNTDQTDITAKVNIKRRTPENRFVIDYLGNFSTSGSTQTVNNHRLNSFVDLFVARRYFWRPLFVEYYRDPFQNVDYRATVGTAAGYHIIDSPKTTWDISGGLGYRGTRYVSVQPGDSQKVTTPALVGGTYYETTLSKTVDFNGRYNFSIVNEDSGTYTHHAIATFETKLTDILDFDISFVWDRTQNPQVRADGTVPKQDDFQLLLTLGVGI